MKVLDLSQDFSMHTPAFASYTGPSIKWVKRLAFDRAGGQEITTTLHVSTHLDAPAHFLSGGKFIGDLSLQWLVGTACVVDLERMGIGDYDLYGPEHFERWEKETGLRIEPGDILVIHTGYHRYYPENWIDRSEVDETRYFIRHPGPTRAFAQWVKDRGVRWIAIDAGNADEACSLLASLEDAKVLAGGQSLVPLLNFRLARPAHLVDINRISGLDRIYERDGGVAVQALARQAAVEDSELVARACPLLRDAVRLVAHRVIRNRGTLCGSIAHADPASELPAVLLALGGHVVARSARGRRTIGADELFSGVFETSLAPDELVEETWFPAVSGEHAILE